MKVVGDGFDGEGECLPDGAELAGVDGRGWVDQQVVDLSGDGAFEAAQDLFAASAGGFQFGGVGAGSLVGVQADDGDALRVRVS